MGKRRVPWEVGVNKGINMKEGVNIIKICYINVRIKDSGISWRNKNDNKIRRIMQLFSRKRMKRKRFKISFKRYILNIPLEFIHLMIKVNFERSIVLSPQ